VLLAGGVAAAFALDVVPPEWRAQLGL